MASAAIKFQVCKEIYLQSNFIVVPFLRYQCLQAWRSPVVKLEGFLPSSGFLLTRRVLANPPFSVLKAKLVLIRKGCYNFVFSVEF